MPTETPLCQVCYEPMGERWRDFDRCIRCQLAADAAERNRPTLTQVSYESPLNRLDREYRGRTV